MIDLTTGVPGSGKTYRLVKKVYDLITSKDKKYKHIFTNINGLDYQKCNKLAGVDDYVRSFEFPDLKKEIDREYSYHQQSKSIVTSDDPAPLIKFDFKTHDQLSYFTKEQLEEYRKQQADYQSKKRQQEKIKFIQKQLKENYDDFLKSLGVFSLYSNSLIIIDECHLYFEDRQDEKLIRFLSYHRHFEIDLDLVTQNKNLINKKYLSFIETMYVAYPASKRIFSKSFRYKKYASYQEYHANIMGTDSLKLSEKVFTLYNSGSNQLGKSILSKLLAPVLVLSLLVGFFFYHYINSLEEPAKENQTIIDNNISKTNNSTTRTKTKIVTDDTSDDMSRSFFIIDCYSKTCIFKGSDMSFTRDSMLKLLDYFSCKSVVNNVVDVNFNTYFFECDDKLKKMLSKTNNFNLGVKNENSNKSFSTTNLLGR